MNKRFTSIVIALGFALGAFCIAVADDGAASPADAGKLKAELAQVQSELQLARTNLSVRTAALWQRQHDIEYSDPEIKTIRAELVALEKQVLEKRKELQVRLALKPELKTLESERKALFQRVEDLRLNEEVIQREISSAQYAPVVRDPAPVP
jgi:chromosome segregation ATPase